MPRHRSPRGPVATSSGLKALGISSPSGTSRHRRAPRRIQRHPLVALVATAVAAGIFVGSQPVSVDAAAEPSRSASGSGASVAQRSEEADSSASRDERQAVEPIVVQPPIVPAADQAVTPDLSESGSGEGPNGTAALTENPCPTEGFGGVKPHVAQAGYHLLTVFGLSESVVGGVAQRPGNSVSDHPRGLALDFMVDTSTGNALAAYAEEHSAELGISYILWQVSAHYDHVHISFAGRPGSGMTC